MTKRATWHPNWNIIPAQDKAPFESMATVLAQPGQVITKDDFSGVSLVTLKSRYYVKTFHAHGQRLKRLIGVSRYQRELKNLRYFATLGLKSPLVAAYGHQNSMGFFRGAMLVTVEVEGSKTLKELIDSGELYTKGIGYVKKLLKQLALAVQVLHQDGFFHRDLNTRNILVQDNGDDCQLYFFDCPSGHHPPWFLRDRGIMRDLAYLERGMRGQVRFVDLLYAYKLYRGVEKLRPEDKRLARASLSYYGQRRMTAKRRKRLADRSLKFKT